MKIKIKTFGTLHARESDYLLCALLIFIIYGFQMFHVGDFFQLFGDPLALLAPERQWVQEGPINIIIGYFLSHFLNYKVAYVCIYFLNLISVVYALNILKKNSENPVFKSFLSMMFLTPIVVIPLMWAGKTDGFLIASIISIAALSKSQSKSIFIWAVIGIFSHPPSFVIQLFGLFILGITRLSLIVKIFFINFIFYSIYLFSIGGLEGRLSYVYENYMEILQARVEDPIFTIFTLFGVFWLFLIPHYKQFKKCIFLYLFIILGAVALTLDTTRVFALLSVPILLHISFSKNLNELYFKFIQKLFNILPYFFFSLFHFQMWGEMTVDSFWPSLIGKLLKHLALF